MVVLMSVLSGWYVVDTSACLLSIRIKNHSVISVTPAAHKTPEQFSSISLMEACFGKYFREMYHEISTYNSASNILRIHVSFLNY